MINTETTQVTYLTRADQTVRYSIPFVYNKNEFTDAPELTVTLDGSELVFGTDYTVNESGLQLVSAVEEGLELVITRTSVFEQLRDFQTGLIDPEQIEGGFDDSVMRDQELKRGLSDLSDALDEKQDIIPDLATIRSGATAGAFAVQPEDLAAVATSGSYNDLSNKPTIPSVGAGVITITQGGVIKGSFGVNQNGDATIEIDEGGGGAVDSVNGKVGVVVLNSSDVGALPNTTKYAASLALSVNPTTFVVTAQLKDQNNNNIGAAQTIDLPLESVVVSGAYDSATKEVVLTLEGGSTIRFSVADLVSGLQTEITSVNMLSADLVDDSNSAHKFVTAADKTTWSGKQDYISDLSAIRAGATAGATAVQPSDLATVATSGSYNDLLNRPTIPTTDNLVPQYNTMPTAGASNAGYIVQYSGESVEDSYQKGYFYLCVPTYSGPSATIAQTVGSGLTGLAVNVNTFVAAEQPSGDEQVNFVSSIAKSMSVTSATQYGVTINVVDQGTLITKAQEILDDQYPGVGYVLDRIYITCYQVNATVPMQVRVIAWSGSVVISSIDISADVASYGFSVSGTLDPAQYGVDNYILNSPVTYTQTWVKGGLTVDVADYGISYTGTPADGDTLTVSYTAPFISGYTWQEQEVQVSTTITVSLES